MPTCFLSTHRMFGIFMSAASALAALAACSGKDTSADVAPEADPAKRQETANQNQDRGNADPQSQENEAQSSPRPLGSLLLDHPHSAITPADANRRIPFRQGDLWGYINEDGGIVVDAQYSEAKPCHGGYCLVSSLKEGKESRHLIDLSGRVALTIPSEYQWTHDTLSSGLLGVCTSNSRPRTCGYLDIDGNTAVPFNYDAVAPFTGEYAVVQFDTGTDLSAPGAAIIDKRGTLISGKYATIYRLWLDHFLFGTRTGVISTPSRWVGTPNGSRLATSIVSQMGISKVDNPDGIPSHDMLLDRNTDKSYKFVNTKTLMTAFEGSFSFAKDFSEGLAAVCRESGDCGYINTKGEWVIDGLEVVTSFKYGVAAVERKKIGPGPTIFIDRSGRQVTIPDYPGLPRIIAPDLIFWAPRSTVDKPALTDRNGALLFHPDSVL